MINFRYISIYLKYYTFIDINTVKYLYKTRVKEIILGTKLE